MIKVLVKVDRILCEVSRHPGVAVGVLAARLGYHKATLSNILKALGELGYVRRDDAGGCLLGPRLLGLAAGEERRACLPVLAEECARLVAEELRETVTVGQLHAGDRFNLAKATVDRTVSVDARIELRRTPYDTATGRVLLAFCAPEDLAEVLGKHGLPGEAWDGVGTQGDLERELAAIRLQGYAEYGRGDARSIAVPILDPGGSLLAAVGASVPAYRLSAERVRHVHVVLQEAALRFRRSLQCQERTRGT